MDFFSLYGATEIVADEISGHNPFFYYFSFEKSDN